ncbi:asparaginase [Actinoplanes regularis]|uniref:asparaginase n=1 Tax=Actinoplanes regularis TaxID=52697 RepID=UPI0024A607D1|nr:asparaginase [Actinoplanes regularis]GLW29313.1 L-asparaginase [Actinoplanes regularis]
MVGLGGTIAMTANASGAVEPRLSAQDLIDAVPGLLGLDVELEVRTVRNRPGASLTFGDLHELAELLAEEFAAGATGAVVTQGTDTIEETSYLLGLLHAGEQPVVVTGAMRNPTLAGADGPANLLAAVTVAASPSARGLGCVVVFSDEIHAAARVRKSHTMSTGTFVSPDGGPLGYLVEGRLRIINRPARGFTLPAGSRTGAEARVALYTATLGDDGGLLPSIIDQVDGLVIAGFGVGHVPESWVGHLETAARRIPVVLTSRTGAGSVATRTYGFPGSEQDLLSRGLIPAGFLSPYKARVLLRLLLDTGLGQDELRAAFVTAGAFGIYPTGVC